MANWTLLHLACLRLHEKIALHLYKLAPESVHAIDTHSYNFTPVGILAAHGSDKACAIFQALLRERDFKLIDENLLVSPSHEIARWGNCKMMEVVFQKLAQPTMEKVKALLDTHALIPIRDIIGDYCGYLPCKEIERSINSVSWPDFSTPSYPKVDDLGQAIAPPISFQQSHTWLSAALHRLVIDKPRANLILLLRNLGANPEQLLTVYVTPTQSRNIAVRSIIYCQSKMDNLSEEETILAQAERISMDRQLFASPPVTSARPPLKAPPCVIL